MHPIFDRLGVPPPHLFFFLKFFFFFVENAPIFSTSGRFFQSTILKKKVSDQPKYSVPLEGNTSFFFFWPEEGKA